MHVYIIVCLSNLICKIESACCLTNTILYSNLRNVATFFRIVIRSMLFWNESWSQMINEPFIMISICERLYSELYSRLYTCVPLICMLLVFICWLTFLSALHHAHMVPMLSLQRSRQFMKEMEAHNFKNIEKFEIARRSVNLIFAHVLVGKTTF